MFILLSDDHMVIFDSDDAMPADTLFTIGQRNSVKLVHKGYDYTKSLTTWRGTKWLCAKKNMTKCKARVRLNTDKSITVLYEHHNHPRKNKQFNLLRLEPFLMEKELF